MQPQKNNAAVSAGFDLSLMRTLVPLKDMSESHLRALIEGLSLDVVCVGQVLFERGYYDGQHVYLLSGSVVLEGNFGIKTYIKGCSTLLPIAHSQPRSVTATAVSDCSILRLDSERLDKLLAWSQVSDYLQLHFSQQWDLDEDIEWMMTLLKSNLFFKVPPINVEHIFSHLTPQVVYAGDVIIRQGEIGEQCYFIKEGKADVWRNIDGNRQHLATIAEGRCFGEDALVNDTVRNASIIMKTDGVLMRLDKTDFYCLLKEPQVPVVSLEHFEAKRNEGIVAVDVRSEEEYNELHLHGAVNIPLHLLNIKVRMLDKNRPYIFYCNTGRRSKAVVHLLVQQGYQALALENCSQLFAQSRWHSMLDSSENFVLKDGGAIKGN
jgi:CRP-like cAMP-binding protein